MPTPAAFALTADSLHTHYGLLPQTARVLIDLLGATHAAALIEARGGCTLLVPKHPDKHPAGARRWAELAEIAGEHGMQALATRYGGDVLHIPLCAEARNEMRNRAVRAAFDALTAKTGDGLSKNQAIYELCQSFRMTSRQLETIVDQPDAVAGRQGALF